MICEYKNGKFKEIGNGGFTWDEKNPYVWNDKPVTFEEYEAKIEKYIDTSKAKHPTGKYKTFSQARKNFNKK